MADDKKQCAGFPPMFNGMQIPQLPGLPKFEDFKMPEAEKVDKDVKKFLDDLDANIMTFLGQMIDLQKSAIKSSKSQMEQVMDDFMKIQDNFTASLPEEVPAVPGLPAPAMTPKEVMKQVKKFQEMSRKHIIEQADSVADFAIKSQEQGRDVTNTVVDKAAEARNGEGKKKKAAPKAADAPAKKKAPAKRKAAPAKEKAEEPKDETPSF